MSTLLIGKYQATIYPEDNGYVGAISLGFDGRGNRKRIKRRGRTKAAVTDKLRKAVDALETGIDASDSYTVGTRSATGSPGGSRTATRTPSRPTASSPNGT